MTREEELWKAVTEEHGALGECPDDAEVCMDDGCSVNAIPTDYAEYTEEYNVFMIH